MSLTSELLMPSVLSTLVEWQSSKRDYPKPVLEHGSFAEQAFYILAYADQPLPLFFWDMLLPQEKKTIETELSDYGVILQRDSFSISTRIE
jgi:hypothetical protein